MKSNAQHPFPTALEARIAELQRAYGMTRKAARRTALAEAREARTIAAAAK